MGVLSFLEQTALATFIRESSSLLAFPTFLCAHTLGLSLLVGANTIVSIRMLGVASSVPLRPLVRLFPFMWIGFILTVISGLGLAIANATTKLVNPILLIKLVLVAVATVIMWILEKRFFRAPADSKEKDPRDGRIFAIAELVLWTGVMVTGRLIAYSATILN